MHPICYVFILLFPFFVLIPSYPLAVGFIYILSCYPILFLGANKGQQSNDLLYTVLLPVRKKDAVFARMITVATMQFVFMLLMSALIPISKMIAANVTSQGGEQLTVPGISIDGFVLILAIAVIGYAIADLIFFPIYYKHGRSIVMSTLLTILGFVVYLAIFTVVPAYLPVFAGPLQYLYENIGIQFAILGGALLVYVALHYLIFRISASRLEKVDF